MIPHHLHLNMIAAMLALRLGCQSLTPWPRQPNGPVRTFGLPPGALKLLSRLSLWLRTVLRSAFDYTWTDLCRSSSTSHQLKKFWSHTHYDLSKSRQVFSHVLFFPLVFPRIVFLFVCFIFILCLSMCLILSFLIFMLRSNRPALPLHIISLIKCEELPLFTVLSPPLVAVQHNWCIFHSKYLKLHSSYFWVKLHG